MILVEQSGLLGPTLIAGVGIFLGITLLLVGLLLVAKKFMVKSGDVTVTINNEMDVHVPSGGSLLSTMAGADIFLPSACGGKGSCGQCKV
ncbi:MAG: 2Fe-2S iron-sulfur cluster binding domain-containing protein, partial [Bacteroidales bacterium]|nr:2Fe-2S iron-sulfur cluster binding domain-containing protein [Bacteroidales bacterium]